MQLVVDDVVDGNVVVATVKFPDLLEYMAEILKEWSVDYVYYLLLVLLALLVAVVVVVVIDYDSAEYHF